VRQFTARGFLILGAAPALAIALAAQAPPQKPADPSSDQQQPPTRFRTEANFVRVDVYPTADGKPVHDLRREDFEILEDGAPQAVEAFEFVQVRPAGPQSARVEPGSVQAGEQMAANPRSRVFIVFLDVPHVTVTGAHAINQPLIRLLDRVLAPEDLVGVMTTAMSASQVTLGRKTEVLARGLRDNWPWGQRFRILPMDTHEEMYEDCYKHYDNGPPLIRKMIARRREVLTLEALEDLVRYLHSVREERKAIITISEGWALYRPDPQMMEPLYVVVAGKKVYEEPPGTEHIGVGPGGKLTNKNWNQPVPATKYQCDTDRRQLSDIDNDEYFRRLLDTANRANASFYTVDPRGLPAFDNEITANVPPALDHAQLRGRLITLQTLAENTDGIAILNSNDIERGLQRVAADLTSYYLLGYYSTNAKLDGRFRKIGVRVKRPGVAVRARRGYLAPTEAEVNAARTSTAAAATSPTAGVEAALGTLSRIRPDARLFVNASAQPGASAVWVAAELPSSARENSWTGGGTAEITVMAGGASETARVTLASGERAFVTPVQMRITGPAQLDVRVRVTAADGSITPATEIIRTDVSPASVQSLVFRRGPTTANRWRPAADFRFSRTERLRVDIPVGADAKPAGGRLLDKSGNPLAVPVTVAERTDDATPQRWLTGELTLAPLAPGDYVVEITASATSGEQKTLTAVRVTR
jgi:VWFA-related protein